MDAVYVRPSDLSLAVRSQASVHFVTEIPSFADTNQLSQLLQKHGVVAGIHNATAAYAVKMIAEGYQFVTLASDSRFMAAKAAEEVGVVRKTGTKGGKLPAY